MVNIKFTTATELAQIDKTESGSASKAAEIMIKTQKVLVDTPTGKKSLLTPYYTGNSIRGKLRRICTALLFEKAVEKGIDISTTTFHLMDAGGGNTYSAQHYDVEKRLREINPVISLFGAGLGTATSKISTSNMMPYRNIVDNVGEYYYEENPDTQKLFSTIKFKTFLTKVDSLLDRRGNAKYMTEADIIKWEKESSENAAEVAKTRGSDDKVKKETIKSFINYSFIIRGVDFYGSLGEIDNITDIERGMLYKALEIFVLENLGAYKSKGFGLCSYELKFDDGSIIKTRVDEFLTPKIIKKEYSNDALKCIEAFESWLEDIGHETFHLEEILKKNK